MIENKGMGQDRGGANSAFPNASKHVTGIWEDLGKYR